SQPKLPAIQRDKFIFLVIKSMPRQRDIRMRHHHAIKPCIIERRLMSAIHNLRAVAPATIHRQHHPPMPARSQVGILLLGKYMTVYRGARKQRAAGLHKIPSIHGPATSFMQTFSREQYTISRATAEWHCATCRPGYSSASVSLTAHATS